jgi:hypothetical protein
MTEPHVIRPSSLTTAVDCGRRWAAVHLSHLVRDAGYTLGERRPLHVGAAIGSGVHAAASFTLEAKRRTGELGNEAEAVDRAEAEFLERAQHGLMWDATTGQLPVAQMQLARMTRSYRRHLAWQLTPLLVEQRFECDVGDNWVLSGQTDTLAGDPNADVRDLKTGTHQRANGVQYACYHIILDAHGYRPHRIIEDFLPRAKLKVEQPPPQSTTIPLAPAIADAWDTIDDIKRRTAEFQRRVVEGGRPPHAAFPANPQSQLCSPRFCPAFGTDFCKSHREAIIT